MAILLHLTLGITVRATLPLETALEHAGDNRAELERALEAMPGRDMEHLVTRARQFDLVNLTSDLLISNLTLARRAFTESDLVRGRYGYEMWRDYVLPYRVMEEDLSDWRPFLREQIQPVIADAHSVQEAAMRIFRWMHEPLEDGQRRIRFVATENRNQNPFQLLSTRNGGCKEMHISYVSALRSVGIPARLCTVGWWTTGDWYHYFVQYYDPDIGDWRGIDASNTAGKDPADWNKDAGGWSVTKAYAYPPYPSVKDVDFMQRWDLCTDITEYVCDTGELIVQFDQRGPFDVGLYTWNIGAWRLIGRARSEDGIPVSITVGTTLANHPVLVSAIGGNSSGYAMTVVEADKTLPVRITAGTADITFEGVKK
ncbi:MAG: transglutaminase-like domain-containing protein [Kiritimatiellia bacterium]